MIEEVAGHRLRSGSRRCTRFMMILIQLEAWRMKGHEYV
jgi:hypothetical protein